MSPPTSFLSHACLVRICGPDPKSLKTKHRHFFKVEAGKTTLSCSGFLVRLVDVIGFDDGGAGIKEQPAETLVVITSAWLIAPFVQETTSQLLRDTVIDVCGEDAIWRQCTLMQIIPARKDIEITARGLLGGGALPQIRNIGPLGVAILNFQSPIVGEKLTLFCPVPQSNMLAHQQIVERGEELCVASSAYGLVSPNVFRNCVTRGIVSNVLAMPGTTSASTETNPCLYLTDARCLAGSEGAPVFLASPGQLMGMLVPTLFRPGQEDLPFELAVVIPIHQILIPPASQLSRNLSSSYGSAMSRALRSVVLVRVKATWGSGVLVDHQNGYVVTCAHVVRGPPKTNDHVGGGDVDPVYVSFTCGVTEYLGEGPPTECTRLAKIIFVSRGAFDVALLQVTNVPSNASPVILRQGPLMIGETVFSVGHAIFDPVCVGGLRSTISRGELAKVLPGRMLQTSAHVFRGHSGGLLADSQGRLIGILTSNAKHSDGRIIPEINFAIPLDAILSVCTFQGHQEVNELEKQFNNDASSSSLKSLWALEPIDLPPSPSSVDVVAPRFAEFLEGFKKEARNMSKL